MVVARIRPEGGELGKGERENLYDLASSAEFSGDIGGKHSGIGASHIYIDIWGCSQPVQDPIEVHKHPLAVVRVDSGNVKSFRKSLAAVLYLVNEYIVHLPVGGKLGTNVAVKFDWIDKIGGYGVFKVYLDDVVFPYTGIKQMLLEEVEKQIALAATANTDDDFYEIIVFGRNQAVDIQISLDNHTCISIFMFGGSTPKLKAVMKFAPCLSLFSCL